MIPRWAHSFWLLTQIPLAARSPDFAVSLERLGLRVGPEPTLMDVVGAFSQAVDQHVGRVGGRTDLGEMAQHAAAESLAAVAGVDLPSLFGPTADDVKLAIGRLAARDRFASLARDFFARLTRRYLGYFLSRELSNFVGPGKSLPSMDAHTAFNLALGGALPRGIQDRGGVLWGLVLEDTLRRRHYPGEGARLRLRCAREDSERAPKASGARCLSGLYSAERRSLGGLDIKRCSG